MFEFSKTKINAIENAKVIRRISSEMTKLGVFVGTNNFNDFSLPAFTDDLIPALENMYKDNIFELYKSISVVLGIKSFFNINTNCVVKDFENVVVGSDYIIYDGVIYFHNPLSSKNKKTLKSSKLFNESDILFKSVGIISKSQLFEIKDIILNNKKVLNKSSYVILERKFQKIIKKSIDNKIEEIKLTVLDTGRVVVEYKKNIGYVALLKEYVDIRNFVDFMNYRVVDFESKKADVRSFHLNIKKENYKSYKIFIHHNADGRFGNLISEISGQDRIDMIESIKSLNSGLVIISSNDPSSERISYQIADQIRGSRSVDITQVDKYLKYKIKDSLFTDDYIKAIDTSSDIILIKCREFENFKAALSLSQKGRLVICYMNSSSIENTLETIKEAFVDSKELALIQLKSIIHISQLDKVCNNCSSIEDFSENGRHHLISKALDDLNFPVSKESESGCELCVSGYIDKINVFEMIYLCDALDRYMKNVINVKDLTTEMKGDDWLDLLSMSMDYLKTGSTTVSSVVTTIGIVN